MSVQVSSNVTFSVSSASPVSASPSPQPVVASPAPAPPTTDSVKLSVSGLVHQLKSQGQTATQIANSLGLTATLVSSYLGSSSPQASLSIPSSPSPATQVTTVGPQFRSA